MTPLDLAIKGYLREFFEQQLNYSKSQMMPFGALPAIIIKEVDKEKFVDELWVHINRRTQNQMNKEEIEDRQARMASIGIAVVVLAVGAFVSALTWWWLGALVIVTIYLLIGFVLYGSVYESNSSIIVLWFPAIFSDTIINLTLRDMWDEDNE